jgi:hypothetical protein
MKNTAGNPFNPQFGKRPAQFIGREVLINDFLQGLENPNDPNRTTIITGIRGSGKTAVLSDVQQSLDPQRHLVVDFTARDGMLLEAIDQCLRRGKRWLGRRFDTLQGLTVGALGFSIGFSTRSERGAHGFRYYISEILDALKASRITTVFLIDEVHNDTPEMREFATTYQHLVREEYEVALLAAGLPNSVQAVLNDKILTFLQRAHRVHLENIDPRIVALTYQHTFAEARREFAGTSLEQAATATQGYPYLIQLIGFFLWNTGGEAITGQDVSLALERAKVELFRNVYDIIYRELSAKDREFLAAMTADESESSFGELVARMAVTSGYASRYRQRMLDAGIVKASSYGKLKLDPPYMREYLLAKS